MKNYTKALVLSAVFLFAGHVGAQSQYTSPKEACRAYSQLSIMSIIKNTDTECLARVGDNNTGFGYTRYYYSGNKLCVESSGEYYNLPAPQTECVNISQPIVTPTPKNTPTPKVKITGTENKVADSNGLIGDIDFSRGTVDLIRNGVTFHVTPNFEAAVGGGDAVRIGEGGIVSIISTGNAVQFGEHTLAEFVGLEFNPPRIVGPDIPEGILDPSYKYKPDDWEFWTHLVEDIVDFNTQNPPKFLLSCLAAELDPKSCGENVATFLHGGVGWFLDKMKEDFPPRIVITPRTAITTNGTEFIVEVAVDGATTVTTLDGSVVVTDLISRKSVEVGANYKITVPKAVKGLSEQELQKNLAPVDPKTINRWWIKNDAGMTEGGRTLFVSVILLILAAGVIRFYIKNARNKKNKK